MVLKKFSLTAVFVEEPSGGYSAYVEEIPGANSQGETIDEARENLKESVLMVLDSNKILSQEKLRHPLKSFREPLRFAE